MKSFGFAIAVLLTAVPAFAWGEAGHFIANEAATLGLPADMPHFFHRAYPQLTWLGYEPDRWKGAGEAADADNSPEHFIDYEFLYGLELPRDRYEYLTLMESSGRRRAKGLKIDETGFVIWRITELAEQLQQQFRQWRTSVPGSSERLFVERSIINTAGVLGHYVADVGNPLHTTMNYNGWAMPNPNGYAIDCETHARFERDFVSHAVTIADVTPKLAPPVLRQDYFAAAIQHVETSNARTERLYQLDKAGAFDTFRRPASADGIAFASGQIAAGSSMLRDLWWSAWKNSGESRRRK